MLACDDPPDAPATLEADRHYFTPGQADRALVLVKRIAADIVRRYARLGDLQEALDRTAGMVAEDIRGELLETIEHLQTHLEELDDVGAELVDWSRGIINFPAKVDGRCVLLCWEPGQERITYWHEVEEGFAGRQPIETLPAASLSAPLAAPRQA